MAPEEPEAQALKPVMFPFPGSGAEDGSLYLEYNTQDSHLGLKECTETQPYMCIF